jgi:glutaredoxin 3
MTVKIYSTPSCPFCTTLKNFLKEHDIEFEDINVAEDQRAAEEMIKKSGQMGVPVADIDGQIVIGFDQERIKQLLNIKD